MSAWQITGCTVADAAALGRNNISAFWEDPTWVLLWPKHITRDFLIEQAGKRYARNLLSDRAATRHQKAVDPNTGALVGYARWILPESHTVDETGQQPAWPDAQVPPVSSAEEEQFRLLAESAWWQFDSGMSGIDDKNHAVMDRICAERPYIKLDYLAVHPNNQGKGIATALVESGIRYAESSRLPLFVMAYKAGRGVYARLGFR